MKAIKNILSLSVALCIGVYSLRAQTLYEKEPLGPQGNLIIIGGSTLVPEILDNIVTLGGGPEKAKILVVPFARGLKDEIGPRHVKIFKEYGVKNVDVILVPREEIDKPENLAKLDSVTVVYFSGGGQNRLARYLEGTEFLERIHKIYQEGGVVAGSSAGAAVQSKLMMGGVITPELKELRKSLKMGDPGYTIFSPGFGFLESVTIYQHFAQRKRQARLFSAIIEYPNLRAVGIDESTAMLVPPDRNFKVIGSHSVTLLEAAETPASGQKLRKIKMKILFPGDTYQL
jgi:cyanophycinase